MFGMIAMHRRPRRITGYASDEAIAKRIDKAHQAALFENEFRDARAKESSGSGGTGIGAVAAWAMIAGLGIR